MPNSDEPIPSSRTHDRRGTPVLGFEFTYGWCALTARCDGSSVTLRASTIVDSFRNLIKAVVHLLDGEPLASAAWIGEGSGYFVDLALSGRDGIAIVIHEMRDGECAAGDWAPARGSVVFTMRCGLGAFCVDLAHELRRLQATYADNSGYMKDWGWRFPADLYTDVEQYAIRFGYRPGGS